ncbi:MAG TPA: hypothetical protein VFT49_01970 [Candidatus Saccharimonadales bacterium]|nr:hypothetical protein [Candidatus Saccharimonadales bacterium]
MTKYYRGTPKDSSPFVSKVPKISWHKRFAQYFDWLFVLVIVFCFVYSLIVKPDPKVIVSSSIYRPASAYQSAAAVKLKSIKDRTKLSFDETSLVSDLKKEFPEISSADVELPIIGQKPIIHLTIATPKFLYRNQSQTYVLSSDGVLVANAASLSSAKSLPLIDDQSGYRAKLGQAAVSASEVDFIAQVVAQCQRAKVPIKSLVLPAAAQELDLKTSDKNYLVKFYIGGNATLQSGQFLAARHQFAAEHQDPAQYLDVRVAGKVFYK